MKFVFGLSYDGTLYFGWQKQYNLLTIQNCLEHVLSKIANHPVHVVCAGRTDRGVHGIEQIAHFETNSIRTETEWLLGCNALLPKDITISWLEKVSDSFHARFSAISRSYRYIIFNHNMRSSFLQKYTYYVYPKLSVENMNKAAKFLLGEHNFISFQSSGCQSISSVRNILFFHVYCIKKMVIFDITANSFLYHMVRNLVGCLIMIGLLKKNIYWAYKVLKRRKMQKKYFTVPPMGLYFLSARYSKFFNLNKKNNFSKNLNFLNFLGI